MKTVLDLAKKIETKPLEIGNYDMKSQLRAGQISAATFTTSPTKVNNIQTDSQTRTD